MTGNFMIPATDGAIQVTEQMRKDAQAAMGSVDASNSLPRLYLCQASGDFVKKRIAADGDWVVSRGDDDVIPLGPDPMFTALVAQTRYRYSVEDENDEDKQKIIWDAPKGKLTRAQDDDVGAKRAKRYTLFALVHVTETMVDPHKIGPIGYAAKGMSTLAGMKWADAVANMIYKGVPPWWLAWKLGSKLEPSIKGRGSWNVLTVEKPLQMNLDAQTNAALKNIWAAADAARKHDEGFTAPAPTEPTDDELGVRADAEADGHGYVSYSDGSGDYATSLPPEDEIVKPASVVQSALHDISEQVHKEPALRPEWVEKGLSWDTKSRTAALDDSAVAIRQMTLNELRAALKIAEGQPMTNRVASMVARMLECWALYKGWVVGAARDDDSGLPF